MFKKNSPKTSSVLVASTKFVNGDKTKVILITEKPRTSK
jgi:hypothetical protein